MSDLCLWSVIGNDGNAPDGDWIGHLWYNRREAELVARDYNKDAKRCPGRDSTAPYKAVAVRVVPAETNTAADCGGAGNEQRACPTCHGLRKVPFYTYSIQFDNGVTPAQKVMRACPTCM